MVFHQAWSCLLRTGWEGGFILNGQNPLSVTKVICRWSFKPKARGGIYVSQYIEILLFVNSYFFSISCESQNYYLNSNTFTTWVAATETSLVVASSGNRTTWQDEGLS